MVKTRGFDTVHSVSEVDASWLRSGQGWRQMS